MCHRVALHDGEDEGRLLKQQRSRVGRQFWFGDPLNVQAAGGGFLGASIVDSFNLKKNERERKGDRERRIMKDCWTTLCNVWLKMS